MLLAAAAGFGQPGTQKLITVNAVATDKRGHPVSGLGSGDFRVFDNGIPQTISFFQQAANTPRTTVILLDLLNNRFRSRSYSAAEIVRALEERESNANIYLYFLTLNRTLLPVIAMPPAGPPRGEAKKESDADMRQTVETAMAAASHLRPRGITIVKQIDDTYLALANIGAQMARFPGRKSLVWITNGVPIQVRMSSGEFFDYTPMLARLSDSLKDAGIAVYPVAISDQNILNDHLSLLALEKIAALTGGLYSVRDVVAAVERASSDGKAAYTLQYYLSDQKQDGKYHKLRVTCQRKDIAILSEQGYYIKSKADGDAQAQKADPADALRNAALLSPYDYKSIPVIATVTKNHGEPPSAHYELQIGVASLLPVDGSQTSYRGSALMTYAEYDNETLPQVSRPTPVKFGANGKRDVHLSGDIQLGRDMRSIRFVVVDPVTRAIGSATIPMSAVQ